MLLTLELCLMVPKRATEQDQFSEWSHRVIDMSTIWLSLFRRWEAGGVHAITNVRCWCQIGVVVFQGVPIFRRVKIWSTKDRQWSVRVA